MAKIGSEYFERLGLLSQFTKNRAMLQNLQRKPNPEKVEYELSKYDKTKSVKKIETKIEAKIEAKAVSTNLNQSPSISQSTSPGFIDQLPPDLLMKWQQNTDFYKEIRAIHERLKLMEKATDNDRQPLTERIARMDDIIRANWELIDAYDPTAPKPEPEQAQIIDHKRINSNRKFLSVNIKKLGELTGEPLEDLRSKIIQRTTEIMQAGEQIHSKTVEELNKYGILL